MNCSRRRERGGTLRILAWITAAFGAAVLVTFLFATRGAEIQEGLEETTRRIKEKVPALPGIPEIPGIPGMGYGGEEDVVDTDPVQPAAPAAPAEPDELAGSDEPAESDEPEQSAYTVEKPPPVSRASHQVAKGDTLYSLAETYYEDGSLWRLIADANDLADPGDLKEGMVVVIPGQ